MGGAALRRYLLGGKGSFQEAKMTVREQQLVVAAAYRNEGAWKGKGTGKDGEGKEGEWGGRGG